jgi:hypothetical protein
MPLNIIENYADIPEKDTFEDGRTYIESVVEEDGTESILVAISPVFGAIPDGEFGFVYKLDANQYSLGSDPERVIADCDNDMLHALMIPGERFIMRLCVESGDELDMPSSIEIEFPGATKTATDSI